MGEDIKLTRNLASSELKLEFGSYWTCRLDFHLNLCLENGN